MTPLIVVDQERHLAGVTGRLRVAGWALQQGFAIEGEDWDLGRRRVVCVGPVRSGGDAAAALLAAARGAGLVVTLELAGDAASGFIAELERVGRVEREAAAGRGPLDEATTTLLRRMAGGESIEEAAAAVSMSARTAYRRIARARRALGVRTTRQAVIAVARTAR